MDHWSLPQLTLARDMFFSGGQRSNRVIIIVSSIPALTKVTSPPSSDAQWDYIGALQILNDLSPHFTLTGDPYYITKTCSFWGYQSSSACKMDNRFSVSADYRKRFNVHQLGYLMAQFQLSPYPSGGHKKRMALHLGVSVKKIQVMKSLLLFFVNVVYMLCWCWWFFCRFGSRIGVRLCVSASGYIVFAGRLRRLFMVQVWQSSGSSSVILSFLFNGSRSLSEPHLLIRTVSALTCFRIGNCFRLDGLLIIRIKVSSFTWTTTRRLLSGRIRMRGHIYRPVINWIVKFGGWVVNQLFC